MTSMVGPQWKCLLLLGVAPLLCTCAESTSSQAPVPVASVRVTPGRDSLLIGDSLQLVAAPRDSAGSLLSDRLVVWASSDSATATVSQDGWVAAHALGSFAISATSEGKTGGAFLSGMDRVVAVALPDTVRLRRYHEVTLIPDLQGALGLHLAGRPISWTSLDPAIIRIDPNGRITPQQLGTGGVRAASGNAADTAAVVVVPESVVYVRADYWGFAYGIIDVGRSESLVVSVTDSARREIDGTPVIWTSTDSTPIRVVQDSVNPKLATVTARGHGAAWIHVASGGVRDSLFYKSRFPVAHWRLAPDTIHLPVGQSRGLTAAAYDSLGNVLTFASGVTPNVIDSGIVVVTCLPCFRLEGVQPGQARVAGVVFDQYPTIDTAIVIVTEPLNERVSWEFDTYEFDGYTTYQMRLFVTDTAGGALPTGRTVTVTSTNASVLAPDTLTLLGVVHDTLITVHTGAYGGVQLVAVVDSQSTSAGVTVADMRPLLLTLTPRNANLYEGDTLRLTAMAIGTDGNPHPFPVVWNSADSATVSVVGGLITAQASGRTIVTATVGRLSDSAAVTVLSPTSPTVTMVSPAPLIPGGPGIIGGAGFHPDPTMNSVTIEGVPVAVVAAADTLLSIRLPSASAFRCDTLHSASIVVGSAGRYTVTQAALAPALVISLDSAGPVGLTSEQGSCIMLTQANTSETLLTVVNTAPDHPTGFVVSSSALPAPAPSILPRSGGQTAGIAFHLDRDSLRRRVTIHRRVLEENRAFAKRWGAPTPLLLAARRAQPTRSVAARIGDLAAVRIPRIDMPDFCSRHRTVVARLVYAGTHALVFEDTLSPLNGMMDSSFQAVGQEFDNVMWPLLTANFGNPLALDSLLDNDGKIAMVFSPVVNTYGVGGFVVSCDYYPETVAPSSNTGEVFYAQVPLTPGTGFQTYTKDVWRWLVRSTIMHEAKHLTAVAERLRRGAPLEDIWLEEASAVTAEELWARTIYSTSWKSDATYEQSLVCDVRPTFAQCADKPYAMFNAFALLHDYAVEKEHRSPFGPTGADATFYGSGWSLLRWTIDRFAGSEDGFLKALTQEPALTGVDNLVARAGVSLGEILSQWSMTLRVDNLTAASAMQFPSWNLPSIFGGMSQDFPLDFNPQPVEPLFIIFGYPIASLPAGSFELFHYPSAPLKQLIQMRALGGGPPPAELRMEVFRIP